MSDATATSPQAVAAKPKRGRRLASESRSDEDRDAVIAWKLTPANERAPATLTALARELGISKSQASYWGKQAPASAAPAEPKPARAARPSRSRAMPARPCEPMNIVTGRHDQWCHCRDCRPDLFA